MSVDQKLNFGRNMNRFAEQKFNEAFQAAGKILPASIVEQQEIWSRCLSSCMTRHTFS
jgi:hypothetical protein